MTFIQKAIGSWAQETFGKARNPKVIFTHLKREIQELEEALEEGRISDIIQESADVAILLFNFADSKDFDLLEAVEAKHRINVRRRWKAPDAEGVCEHDKAVPVRR